MRYLMLSYFAPLSILLFLLTSCREDKPKEKIRHDVASVIDLDEIKEKGKLVAITDYNSTNYFLYRGQPLGYQYELLQDLADHLGTRLEVIVNNDLEETFQSLASGECNLVAINLTVTRERKKIMDFTEPHSQTRQVLVQRKPANWKKMSASEIELKLIRNQIDIGGKIVYVQQNSSYAVRLRNLAEEIGDSIIVREVPEEAETLIMLVADGEIDYTVCDENVALVNQTYYPQLDVSTDVSFPQNMAWAVQKGATHLKKEIDKWLTEYKKSARYAVIYNKYFRNQRSAGIVKSDLFTLTSGKISKYDDAIKKYSQEINWDWRLLASLIYQESRFDPGAQSWAGAFGLMQLMPNTARRYGVNQSSGPVQQIRAGTKFIAWLDDRFKDEISDQEERIKFILAAYNVGPGHIFDAMRLAEKHGGDPDKWDNSVDEYLLKKSDPRFYKDPVVTYGYARGIETYNFVIEVLERYEHYKNVISEEEIPAS